MKSTPLLQTKVAIIGSDSDPANNIKLHRAGNDILQFVPADDITPEGSRSLNSLVLPGMVPVGTIISWIPGYFGDGTNDLYTRVFGSTNDVIGANGYLNGMGWNVCDGTSLSDSDSPLYNGLGRYLPNLTDSRFFAGATLAGVTSITDLGVIGGTSGSSTMVHTHSISSQPTFTISGHYHGVNLSTGNVSHTHTTENKDVNHLHDGSTLNTNPNGDHSHTVPGYQTPTGPYSGLQWLNNQANVPIGHEITNTGGVHWHSIEGDTGLTSILHNHVVDSTVHNHPISGFVGNTGGDDGDVSNTYSCTQGVVVGAASNVENRPKYLSCFYILRVK